MSGTNVVNASGNTNPVTSNNIFYSDVNLAFAATSSFLPLALTNINAVDIKIIHILSCQIGSYEFEPKFGSRVPYLLWEPCDNTTAFQLRTAVLESLNNPESLAPLEKYSDASE